jgi:hypothetical protein
MRIRLLSGLSSGFLRPQNQLPLNAQPIMKLFPAIFVATFATAASPCMGADGPDLGKLPPPAKKDGVTYAKDIRPVFEASCFRCHTGDRPKAGLRLDSLDSVLKGSKEGRVIIPGESDKSALVIAVARLDEESAMPPKPRQGGFRGGPGRPGGAAGPPPPPGGSGQQSHGGSAGGPPPPPKPLTAEQVSLIRAWVDQGAK